MKSLDKLQVIVGVFLFLFLSLGLTSLWVLRERESSRLHEQLAFHELKSLVATSFRTQDPCKKNLNSVFLKTLDPEPSIPIPSVQLLTGEALLPGFRFSESAPWLSIDEIYLSDFIIEEAAASAKIYILVQNTKWGNRGLRAPVLLSTKAHKQGLSVEGCPTLLGPVEIR